MKLVKFFLSVMLLFSFQMVAFAQDPLGGRDLSTIKVEALTDNQISTIQQKLKQSGMTIDQVESQAIAKGMSPTEFAKLKDRVNGISGIVMAKSIKKNTSASTSSNNLNSKDTANISLNPLLNTAVYGSELFSPSNTGNSVNKFLATPLNYEIGPNDVLKLVIYGVQEYSADLTVSKEGKIYIDNVGNIKIGGLTIEAAKSRIKQQMSATAYSSLSRGESKIDLTLGDIRTIHVNVIGAFKSGSMNGLKHRHNA